MTERPSPPLTPRTAAYWRSGADGILRIAHCQSCGLYLHPPRPICSRCHARDIRFDPVSGRGTIWSFTINRYQWVPTMPPPYIIAEVDLDEQAGLRILTNIVDIDIADVRIAMPVQVRFEQAEDVWIPVFHP